MDDLWSRFFDSPSLLAPAQGGDFLPVLDIKETPEAFEVTAEVPGLKPEEIEVSLTGDILTIKGEKKEEKEEKKADYHLVERRYGSFVRSFRLPVDVVKGKVQATQKDGVLHLVLPKGKKEMATKVQVKAA
ncbi:MAG: Hsp20/alpha crystallin family protein [Thermodesulfobacteriota bacterium]